MPVAMLSSSLITEPKRYGRFNALDTPQPTKPGMVLVSPTSIDHSGTSATLGENGQVTFNAVTSLSLNEVFSADFDNYVVSFSSTLDANNDRSYFFRLRASGTDATGATDYTWQQLNANSTTVSGARASSDKADISKVSDDYPAGMTLGVYGPYLSQPTAARADAVGSLTASAVILRSAAFTHSLSTSYDGFTIYIGGESMTGKLAVYGVRS